MPLPGCRTIGRAVCSPFDPLYMPEEGMYDGLDKAHMPDQDRDTLNWIIEQSGLDMFAFTLHNPLVVDREKRDRFYTYQLVDGYHRLWVARQYNSSRINIEIQERIR